MTHQVAITRAGDSQPIRPDGVVLLDPTTGSPVAPAAQGLTDTQLRAAAVPVAPNITRGAGVNDANTQRVTLASDGPAVTQLTAIDAKTPALVGGAVPVGVMPRVALATYRLSLTATVQGIAAAIGTSIPAGAVMAEIQPDGGTIRISRVATPTLTTTTGVRVDDGTLFTIDSVLASVQLCSASGTVPAQLTFFDRV